jgi:hypothetical protein
VFRAVIFVFFAAVLVIDVSARQDAASAHGWLAAGDVVVEDFEGDFKISPAGAKENPSLWRSTGDAFQAATQVSGDIPYSWACGGRYIVSNPINNENRFRDAATGTLTSPESTVKKGYLSFLVGGPRNIETIAVQLLHEGRIVRAATGSGTAALRMVAFNMTEFMGKNVRIRLVDKHTSVGGYIKVDSFVQTDTPSTKEVIAGAPKMTPSVVRTLKGKVKGEVFGQGDHLAVGGQAVPMDTLLSWINCSAPPSPGTGQGVLLRNGEFLSGKIGNYEDGVVPVSTVFGERELKLSDISTIVFAGPSRPTGNDAPNTLYRRVLNPIPGKLVWIKTQVFAHPPDIAVESVMGTLPVPLKQIARYVVEPLKADAVEHGSLEVALSDGSIVYSKTPKFEKGQLLVQHPILGDLQVELSTIVYMRRTPKGAFWLAAPDKTQATGLVSNVGVKPELRDPKLMDEACLSALRMYAKSSATYELPASQQKGVILRGALMPIPNARADMQVSIQAAGKTVWQTSIKAGSAPVEIAVNLPHSKDFTIAVASDGKAAVPCGVEWLDAHLLSAQAAANITKGPNERS